MKKKQKLKERICALVLALAMVLTWVLPDAGMTVQAAAGDAKKVTLKFKDAARGNTRDRRTYFEITK